MEAKDLILFIAAAGGVLGGFWALIQNKTPSSPVKKASPLQEAAAAVVDTIEDALNALPTSGTLTQQQVEQLMQATQQEYFQSVDWRVAVTVAYIESHFRIQASLYEGHLGQSSLGLMQVLPMRASDLYRWGYREFPPSETALSTAEVSAYYGMANLHRLQAKNKGLEWTIRAYNGGEGWQNTNRGPSMTANHWRKFQEAWQKLGYAS